MRPLSDVRKVRHYPRICSTSSTQTKPRTGVGRIPVARVNTPERSDLTAGQARYFP
jgi:hypothetical protein